MADIDTEEVVTTTTIRNDFDSNDDFVNDTQVTSSVTTTYDENVMVSYVDQEAGTYSISVDNYTDNRVVTDGSTISGSLDQTSGELYLGKTETSLGFNSTTITITDDNVDFSGAVLSGVGDPTADDHAANKGYVDSEVSALSTDLNNQLSVFQAGVDADIADINTELQDFQTSVNGQISDLRSDLNNVEESLSKSIAISNALEVFMPDPGKKFRVTVGAGSANSETGIGITGAGTINEKTAVYFGVGTDFDGDETGGKIGVSYQW